MTENTTHAEQGGPTPETGDRPTGGGPTTAPPPYPSSPPPQARPPLRRSRSDRVLGGVCGGFARQYGIDPVLLRILVVVLTVFTGGAFALAYVVAWILIPDDPPWAPVPAAGQAPVSYAAGGTGTYAYPQAPGATGATWQGVPAYAGPSAPREPRSHLGLIAVSVAILVGGVLSLFAAEGADIPVATVTAVMLGVVAIGLVVGAFVGRARWLIVPALVLLLVTQSATAVSRAVDGAWTAGVGDRTWTPTSSSSDFQLGAGDARLDLTALPPGPGSVGAHLGAGQLVVTIRPDTAVSVHARVGAGTVVLPDRPATSGTNQVVDVTVPATTGSTPVTTVDLTVDIGLGQLEVRRAAS